VTAAAADRHGGSDAPHENRPWTLTAMDVDASMSPVVNTRLICSLWGVFLTLASAAQSAGNSAPAERSLFNGRDLAGWVVKCRPADATNPFWRVEDGVIVADSMSVPKHDYVWLVSERPYTNFVLSLQFRAFRDSPGNSGVQLRSRYDDAAGWLDGPQVDIHPAGPWRTGMLWDETRDSQRWLFPPVLKGRWVDESMARPPRPFVFGDASDPWNRLIITADGTRIVVTLNGTTITDYDGAGVLDDAVHREHGVGLAGHLALQIHTGDRLRMHFRNLTIRELTR
jgi:hypothetical protein